MYASSGSQLITADGVVGTSGLPVRIFSIHIISGTAAVVSLKTGAATCGAIWVTETGTLNTGKTFNYGEQGLRFPAGCFVDVDANTTSVLVTYAKEF